MNSKNRLVGPLLGAILILITAQASLAIDVVGSVSDGTSQTPLAGSTIIIHELSLSTVTDVDGNFVFLGVPEGVYTFMIGRENYRPVMMPGISVSTGCCIGRVGDANSQGGDEPTIGDVSILIDAKFISGTCEGRIVCFTEGDINQSGGLAPTCIDLTIGDISLLIDYLFITGPSLGLPDCL